MCAVKYICDRPVKKGLNEHHGLEFEGFFDCDNLSEFLSAYRVDPPPFISIGSLSKEAVGTEFVPDRKKECSTCAGTVCGPCNMEPYCLRYSIKLNLNPAAQDFSACSANCNNVDTAKCISQKTSAATAKMRHIVRSCGQTKIKIHDVRLCGSPTVLIVTKPRYVCSSSGKRISAEGLIANVQAEAKGRLTLRLIESILELCAQGFSPKEICAGYGVTLSNYEAYTKRVASSVRVKKAELRAKSLKDSDEILVPITNAKIDGQVILRYDKYNPNDPYTITGIRLKYDKVRRSPVREDLNGNMRKFMSANICDMRNRILVRAAEPRSIFCVSREIADSVQSFAFDYAVAVDQSSIPASEQDLLSLAELVVEAQRILVRSTNKKELEQELIACCQAIQALLESEEDSGEDAQGNRTSTAMLLQEIKNILTILRRKNKSDIQNRFSNTKVWPLYIFDAAVSNTIEMIEQAIEDSGYSPRECVDRLLYCNEAVLPHAYHDRLELAMKSPTEFIYDDISAAGIPLHCVKNMLQQGVLDIDKRGGIRCAIERNGIDWPDEENCPCCLEKCPVISELLKE